jgi:hypothetical protein
MRHSLSADRPEELAERLNEAFRRLDDIAEDLERIDRRRRPYGDGESDLSVARWYRHRPRTPRHFPLVRVGDGR